MDAKSVQKRMNEIQNSEQIQDLLGKLVSGRPGFKAVIDKSKPTPKCPKCNNILSGDKLVNLPNKHRTKNNE